MYIIIASERINEIPTIKGEVLILAKEDSMLPARCFCNNYQIECFPETQFSAIAIAFRLGTKIKEETEESITILCGSDEILEGLRQLPFKEQLKLEKLVIHEEVKNSVNKHKESAVSNQVEKMEEKEDAFPMNQPQDQPEEQTQESIPVPSTTVSNKKERKKKEPVKKETKKNQSISHLKAKGNLLTPGTIKMK